jgi:hypothetical protein
MPRRVQTFWLTYVPGIELTKQAIADGALSREEADRIDRGETRIFRHPHLDARGDDSDGDFYRRYDILFRAMPFFPQKLRERLRVEHVPRLGDRAASAVGFVFDLANALRRIDKETIIFAKHYGRKILEQLPELVLGRVARARRRAVRAPIHDGVTLPAQAFPDAVTLRPAPRSAKLRTTA